MVGARSDADHVLTVFIDKDQGDARRNAVTDPGMTDVDPLAPIEIERTFAKVVRADRGDENNLAASARAATAWLAPLPPGVVANGAPQHRLPRRRKPRQSHRHIRVAGSNDKYFHFRQLSVVRCYTSRGRFSHQPEASARADIRYPR